MAKFQYKFKTIKDIKERLEKKTQKELAIIDLEIKNKNEEIVELTKQLQECNRKKLESKSNKIKDLHFYEKYQRFLIEQIELVQKYILARKKDRAKKMLELIKKTQETKTFEKLEEKHLTEFLKVQDKLEQKEMDEIAVNEFVRE
ncbi:MAG: flagellar export protein FliJ [Melioribacteraceae bacterium]|nr:flagellar export protein FliJ [Melioribacteraceae bacterium]